MHASSYSIIHLSIREASPNPSCVLTHTAIFLDNDHLLFQPQTKTMAAPGGKQLGVTAPLSMTVPTEAENKASNALIEELKRLNNYETTADTNKR